jgi:hypothetical protein
MLRPLRRQVEDPLVHAVESLRILGVDLVLGYGDEVDVAVLIVVAERERALQVQADQVRAQHVQKSLPQLA